MNCRNNGSERMKEQSLQWTGEKIGIVKVQRYIYLNQGYEKFCEDFQERLKPLKPKYNKKDVVFTNNKWRNTTQKHKKGAALNSLVKKGLNPPKIIEGADDGSDILATVGMIQECDTKTLPAEKSVYENLDQCRSDDENGEFDLDPAFLNMATYVPNIIMLHMMYNYEYIIPILYATYLNLYSTYLLYIHLFASIQLIRTR